MRKTMLACCKLYISESRNPKPLTSIETSLNLHPKTLLINKFTDQVYNRVGYTLVSTLNPNKTSPLKDSVFDMVKIAFETLNLESHVGSHPRLGVVDHICFHPLKDSSLDQVADLAKLVAAQIGEELQVPTYLYGAASNTNQTLASIRRELGYFKQNSSNNKWTGSTINPKPLNPKPDFGPQNPKPSKGILTIGATNWVDNYNVPILNCTDLESVRIVARKVSERGGGLERVQAMGLERERGEMEVACNLLEEREGREKAERVQREVERLGRERGLEVGEGYFTDYSQEKIVELLWYFFVHTKHLFFFSLFYAIIVHDFYSFSCVVYFVFIAIMD
ncbi:hypothetical protein LUZ60_005527 [Juncus effusus]|nr:hypothetical protein LUZ60_005527 [Juncus effusus]